MDKRGLFVIIFFVFLLSSFVFLTFRYSGFVSINVPSSVAIGNVEIEILNPENTTYNLLRNESFVIRLNVSAGQTIQSWRYSLYEPIRVRGSTTLGGNAIYTNVSFFPNTTFNAVRFSNVLHVFANNSIGQSAVENVTFLIEVNNSAPQINISGNIIICEGSSNEPGFLDYDFSANDSDENDLYFDIAPAQPAHSLFYVQGVSQNFTPYLTYSVGNLYSSSLYNNAGSYLVNVSVGENDGSPALSDRTTVNVTVIEINSAPVILNELGPQNIVANGSNYEYDFNASDDESGNDESGGLNFNISFEPDIDLFEITENGLIDFTAVASQIGYYNVTVCVSDQGLPFGSISPNISLCGQDGSNRSDCNVFEMLISEEQEFDSSDAGSGAGGGGGGGGTLPPRCTPKWGCQSWNDCQSSKEALIKGDFSGDSYRELLQECEAEGYGDSCGYQKRECVDIFNCNKSNEDFDLVQACLYTINPNCFDGIKNCHGGQCEFLVDCGGSCGACATCSDGIQNQGESGVDCGEPCPNQCIKKEIISKENRFKLLILVLGGFLILIVVLIIIRHSREKEKEKKVVEFRKMLKYQKKRSKKWTK